MGRACPPSDTNDASDHRVCVNSLAVRMPMGRCRLHMGRACLPIDSNDTPANVVRVNFPTECLQMDTVSLTMACVCPRMATWSRMQLPDES